MGKKQKNIEKWETLLKFKREYFDITEFKNYNPINGISTKGDMVTTPYVKFKETKQRAWDFTRNTPVDKEITYKEKTVELGSFTKKKNKGGKIEEKEWLKKSVNVFNSASVNRVTVVLERNSNKIKLSIFKFAKSRNVGHRYFAKYSDDLHITFNTTTKNFFITKSVFHHRKRRTNTTKNDFNKILRVINTIQCKDILLKQVWFEDLENRNTNKQDLKDLKEFFKKMEMWLYFYLGVNFNLDNEGLGTGLGRGILRWFVKVWKIKTPNHYYPYLLCHYPGIRKLKKHKMNLGRTILANKGLHGKYYIKLINEPLPYNLNDLKMLENILGSRYAKMVPKTFLKITKNYDDSKYEVDTTFKPDYTKLLNYEKLNLIKILADVTDSHFLSYIDDHINTQHKLKGYGLNVKIKSKTRKQFDEEHKEWSDLLHLCERNKETTYLYDPTFIEKMQKPLYGPTKNKKYEVKVLKTDLEYFQEGQFQHHCVRTYLDRYDSIIVSIRNNDTQNPERVTVEFNYGNKSIKDYRAPRMVQAQMKYNHTPTGDWIELVKKLNERFKTLEKLEKPKIEVYNKISGQKNILDSSTIKNPVTPLYEYNQINYEDDLPF